MQVANVVHQFAGKKKPQVSFLPQKSPGQQGIYMKPAYFLSLPLLLSFDLQVMVMTQK